MRCSRPYLSLHDRLLHAMVIVGLIRWHNALLSALWLELLLGFTANRRMSHFLNFFKLCEQQIVTRLNCCWWSWNRWRELWLRQNIRWAVCPSIYVFGLAFIPQLNSWLLGVNKCFTSNLYARVLDELKLGLWLTWSLQVISCHPAVAARILSVASKVGRRVL